MKMFNNFTRIRKMTSVLHSKAIKSLKKDNMDLMTSSTMSLVDFS